MLNIQIFKTMFRTKQKANLKWVRSVVNRCRHQYSNGSGFSRCNCLGHLCGFLLKLSPKTRINPNKMTISTPRKIPILCFNVLSRLPNFNQCFIFYLLFYLCCWWEDILVTKCCFLYNIILYRNFKTILFIKVDT